MQKKKKKERASCLVTSRRTHDVVKSSIAAVLRYSERIELKEKKKGVRRRNKAAFGTSASGKVMF